MYNYNKLQLISIADSPIIAKMTRLKIILLLLVNSFNENKKPFCVDFLYETAKCNIVTVMMKVPIIKHENGFKNRNSLAMFDYFWIS